MNYDRIIIEMLDRIQALEEQVADLSSKLNSNASVCTEKADKVSTSDIKNYIQQQIDAAKQQKKDSITLRASDIHRQMKLKSRFPMVCNAMRQCMKDGDRVIHETASGYSSSLEILYYCQE